MNLTGLFKKHGRPAVLCSSNGETVSSTYAFISPLRYKNKMYLYGVNTEIGYNSQGHYLYIGPPLPDLTDINDGDYITAGETKYRIDRAEKVYAGQRVLYIWAVIRTIVEN